MTKRQRLYAEHGQSPWLDNITRGYLRDARLARMVGDGIRGATANPTIFAKAIGGSADYDEQFESLIGAGCPVEHAHWELVIADITDALAVLRPLFDASGGTDGFVSVEVAPEAGTRHRGHDRFRPRPPRADRRAEPLRQDPRD